MGLKDATNAVRRFVYVALWAVSVWADGASMRLLWRLVKTDEAFRTGKYKGELEARLNFRAGK